MSAAPPDNPPPAERERPSAARAAPGSRPASPARVIVWVLAALLVAFTLVRLPNAGWFLAFKAFALETAGVVLAIFVVSRGDWTWERARAALISGPNPFILAFLLLIGVSSAAAPPALARFSHYEAMRHLGGGLVYFGVAYGLTSRRHLGQMVALLCLAGTLAALVAFRGFGDTSTPEALAGAFRNQQLLAGFLCLVFPVALAASRTDEVAWRRIAIQVAVVAIAAGVLVARNRSAWAGSLIALVVMAVLFLKYGRVLSNFQFHRAQLVVPALMVALSIGLFLAMSGSGRLLSVRAGTVLSLSEDISFKQRLGMWDKARRMIRDRPLTGWGVGLFPIEQTRYYHRDVTTFQPVRVMTYGPTLNENAHNTYLQLGAELGIPGLLLYLSIFAAFFVTGIRALPRLQGGFRQALLIACLAAIAGQMVAGIGSPAWEFAECSLVMWLVLGLGMAAAGLGTRGMAAERD